jgi:hypothetical protein
MDTHWTTIPVPGAMFPHGPAGWEDKHFLPAAGWRDYYASFGSIARTGAVGAYWASHGDFLFYKDSIVSIYNGSVTSPDEGRTIRCVPQ